MLNTGMIEHLYDDGVLTVDAKNWFLDVVDGHIALLPEQHAAFFHLLELKGQGEFYDDDCEAFIYEFPRVELKFHQMVQALR